MEVVNEGYIEDIVFTFCSVTKHRTYFNIAEDVSTCSLDCVEMASFVVYVGFCVFSRDRLVDPACRFSLLASTVSD